MPSQLDPVVRKIQARLIPFLFLCYIVNYLDRFNLSFAAMDFRASLGLSYSAYGLGAGIFFAGYVLFEIPSNLMLKKLGARRWIARIMISWGLVSSAMTLVHSTTQFYLLRFCLGAAEAGFFPGIAYYLTHWIPRKDRARTLALFLTSIPLSSVLGAPLATLLLGLRGASGLEGWQWLFLLEGIPSVALGISCLFFLDDQPKDASWLNSAEKEAISKELRAESKAKAAIGSETLAEAFKDPRVWALCLQYFLIVISFYGISFWLPQMIKSLSSLSNSASTLLSALPFLCAAISMVLVARSADRHGDHQRKVTLCIWTGAASLALGALLSSSHPILGFVALCVTASAVTSTMGPFWAMPTQFLSGTAAAAGIALINSCGNIGGFVGPNIVGLVKEATQSFEGGLLALAGTLVIAGLAARPKTVSKK